MPNFIFLDELNSLPPNRKNKGGSGPPPMTDAQIEKQMKMQEEMMVRQIEMQQKFQRDTEERLRIERERDRLFELSRREQRVVDKKAQRETEEKKEAALFKEMTSPSGRDTDTSDYGGGFNLDMPTIERPDYEQQSRPI